MNDKKYRFIIAVITAATAGVMLAGILLNSYIIPAIAVVIGLLLAVFFRKQFSELTVEDERMKQISAVSGRIALSVFCMPAAIAGLLLLITQKHGNAELRTVGYTLCYSVCAMLLIDLVVYFYLNKKQVG